MNDELLCPDCITPLSECKWPHTKPTVVFDTGWLPGAFRDTVSRERIMSAPITQREAVELFGGKKNESAFISNHNPLCIIQERLTRNHFEYQN